MIKIETVEATRGKRVVRGELSCDKNGCTSHQPVLWDDRQSKTPDLPAGWRVDYDLHTCPDCEDEDESDPMSDYYAIADAGHDDYKDLQLFGED